MSGSLADFDQPVARDGGKGVEALATTLRFTDSDITIESGDVIYDVWGSGKRIFKHAIRNERGMWTVVYEHGPGGHGTGWLKMKLHTGDWTLDEKQAAQPGVQEL